MIKVNDVRTNSINFLSSTAAANSNHGMLNDLIGATLDFPPSNVTLVSPEINRILIYTAAA